MCCPYKARLLYVPSGSHFFIFHDAGRLFWVLCIVQASHPAINATVSGKWVSLTWRWPYNHQEVSKSFLEQLRMFQNFLFTPQSLRQCFILSCSVGTYPQMWSQVRLWVTCQLNWELSCDFNFIIGACSLGLCWALFSYKAHIDQGYSGLKWNRHLTSYIIIIKNN